MFVGGLSFYFFGEQLKKKQKTLSCTPLNPGRLFREYGFSRGNDATM